MQLPATQWLSDKLSQIQSDCSELGWKAYNEKKQEIVNQANEMFAEQIAKAHGRKIIRASKPNFKEMTGEEYYKLNYSK
jgi:hypothetical protein